MSKENKQKFTKLHKFLFTDEKFKSMKSKSKLLYAIITERQNLSVEDVKNNKDQSQYLDENKRLFSIYSNYDLKELLNVSEPTIIKLKKELIKFNLLEEVRVANACNRLYPKKPYDEYFYANDLDEFYRLPHGLFDNSFYNGLSADAIIAYAIYLSRYEYSIYKNHFYDKDNNIYCIFTNEELADILNVERRKISKIKNELIYYNLLTVTPTNRADYLYIKLPKACHSKELKKMHIGNLKKCTSGTKKNAHQELKKMHTSNTDLSNTDLSNTDLSNTTTKQKNNNPKNISKKTKGSSSSKQQDKNIELLNLVKSELNINITKQYKNTLLDLFKHFDQEVVEFAIEYTSMNANSPKQYLIRILENWIKAGINTLEQAKAYKSVSKSNTTASREMTPKWLEERDSNKETSQSNTSDELEEDEELKADREAFLKHLKEYWGE